MSNQQDQELIKKVKQIKKQQSQAKINEPAEEGTLRKIVVDAINNSEIVNGYKLKLLVALTFGIPQDTIEIRQLHELQIAYDRRFAEIRQEQKIIRYIIIAIGAVLGVPEVIRLFGFG